MTGILSPLLDVSPGPAGASSLHGPGSLLLSLQIYLLTVARLVLTNDTHGHKKVGSGPGLLHHNRLGFSVIVTSTLHSPIDGLTPI